MAERRNKQPTAMYIGPSLLKLAKVVAALEGTSVSSLVNTGLTRLLLQKMSVPLQEVATPLPDSILNQITQLLEPLSKGRERLEPSQLPNRRTRQESQR